MGNTLNRLRRNRPATVLPPSSGARLTSDQVRDIVQRDLKPDKMYVGDGDYLAYQKAKLQEFLKVDRTNEIKYKSETFDCDDFGRVLAGEERKWFRGHNQGNRGSTLGTVWGDIRPSEDYAEPYYHALNFFISSDEELWLIEPQSDHMYKPTSNSTFWFACV